MTITSTTEYLDATQGNPSTAITRAAEILRDGGTVAFPTETVYGLAANALNPTVIAKIFAAKQRPAWDPLIVHISDRLMLDRIAEVTSRAQLLIEAFWPGPLTLLLPRTAAIPDAVTAGRPLVGVRMPAHPIALALIRAASFPLAAPSANRFGHTSPTTAAHVTEDLLNRIDAILDGGPTQVGLESTVLDPATLTIYRPGAITSAMLEAALGPEAKDTITLCQPPTAHAEPQSLLAPGTGIRHYAPRARLILVADPTELRSRITELSASEDLGVMLPKDWPVSIHLAREVYDWQPWADTSALARTLFAGLRYLDSRAVTAILCPLPPAEGLGLAIRDRLQKAAQSK